MTTTEQIKTLNKLWAPLGLIPSGPWGGETIYQYKRGNECRVTIPKRAVSPGLYSPEGNPYETLEYELGYQSTHDDERWVIAKWLPPFGTREEYRARYGAVLDYPSGGYWLLFLPLDFEPTEGWTRHCLALLLEQTEKDYDTHLREIRDREKAKKLASYDQIYGMVEELTMDHIPGVRGGKKSFPLTQKEQSLLIGVKN